MQEAYGKRQADADTREYLQNTSIALPSSW